MKQEDNYTDYLKRFARGDQNIFINRLGDIEHIEKCYTWQSLEVFNKIPIYIRPFLKAMGDNSDTLYYKGGLIDNLVPLQRRYNLLRNREIEIINRISMGVLLVEDGSVDICELESDGISPGSIIVYRQGSKSPQFVSVDDSIKVLEVLRLEEDAVLKQMSDECTSFAGISNMSITINH